MSLLQLLSLNYASLKSTLLKMGSWYSTQWSYFCFSSWCSLISNIAKQNTNHANKQIIQQIIWMIISWRRCLVLYPAFCFVDPLLFVGWLHAFFHEYIEFQNHRLSSWKISFLFLVVVDRCGCSAPCSHTHSSIWFQVHIPAPREVKCHLKFLLQQLLDLLCSLCAHKTVLKKMNQQLRARAGG